MIIFDIDIADTLPYVDTHYEIKTGVVLIIIPIIIYISKTIVKYYTVTIIQKMCLRK